jgi:hypothetical protein
LKQLRRTAFLLVLILPRHCGASGVPPYRVAIAMLSATRQAG